MSSPNRPFRFRFRKELLFDGAALHDPLTDSVHPLTDLACEISQRIASEPTADELTAELLHLSVAHRAEVQRELRQFVLLGLLEDTCSTIRERLELARRGEGPPPRVLKESRFRCQNSGECCRGYVFGPISEGERARIEALDPRRELGHLGTKPLFVEMGSSSGVRRYRLATVDDVCVFLEGGLRCGLHRAFGASAKPALCQLYPLAAVSTIDGLKVYDRGECATFAVSAQTGDELEHDIPRIRQLVSENVYHPSVRLQGSWRCDYGLVLQLADRLDGEARLKPPLQALHAIGHVVRGVIVALTQCPFEAGQPETALTSALARSAEHLRPPEEGVAANARVGLRTFATLADALAERAAPHERHTPVLVAAVSLLSEVCYRLLDERPVSATATAALGISIDGESEGVLKLSLRHQLFGADLLLDDHLPAGLLRMAFVIALTLAGARVLALDNGRIQVSPRDLSVSHMIVKRTLHRPEPHRLLGANGDQVWPILDALPLLAQDLGKRQE